MEWEKEIDELKRRRGWAEELGGAKSVARQHERGRLTVRERIDALVDTGSFQEVGKLTGEGIYEDGKITGVVPAPYVMGLAKIDGRPVAVGGEDFTVRGGASWKGDRRKGGQGGFIEDLADQFRIPLVNLADGSGGSVTSAKRRGHAVFPGVDDFGRSIELMSKVPVVTAVTGTAAGGPAGRAILSHWSVMVKDTSQVFAAGPRVVERSLGQTVTNEELGGSRIASDKSGTIDNVAQSEADAFALLRRFLSYMPRNVWEAPPVVTGGDPVDRAEEALADFIPRNRRQPYDMRRLISLIVDDGETLEIQPVFGNSVLTMLARMGGYPVGVIANNPMVNGGAMDHRSARKQTHFMEMCDAFHIPLVMLVDVPGFMVGVQAESAATLREGMRTVYVAGQLTVPVFTVVIRKCYGMAGMATCDKAGIDFKLAWPSAEWGSLPVEGGVAVAYRREIAEAPDPAARERELEDELRAFSSPFRTAEAFGVEDIIDPRETRAYLCRFIEAAQGRIQTGLGIKYKSGVRP